MIIKLILGKTKANQNNYSPNPGNLLNLKNPG